MVTGARVSTRTVCSYCGVGCGIVVETSHDSGSPVIAKVLGDKLHPTNFGRLCTKGATHAEMMLGDGRMTTAYARPSRRADRTPVSVDDATRDAGTRLRAIVDEHGPDAVALYVSGQMSFEAQYLATKLAKGFIRTKHIESNSRLCMASAGTGYKQSLGADGPPGSYTDFDTSDLFFVIGANMADCHPILFLRMADRLKAGAKLIVVDPRRNTTADKADLFLQITPGTDLALLNGLLHLLVESGDIDQDFIAEHTEGWDAMPAFLADYTPDRVATITGLAEADIRTAATWIGEAGSWMSCWTMGLNQSTHGTWSTNAICNLHLATGAICTPGSGPMSLTGQPNAMGGREMGYMGPGLPGQRAVLSADDRAFVESQWGLDDGTIRTDVGPGTIEMFSQLVRGDIKAVWIICTNPVASVANRKTVIDGLEKAELVIAQDTFTETATNTYADILLPATLWAEADSVMINSERNMTLLQQSIEPAGDARPDWKLISDVACAMGFASDFDYKSSEEIFDEITRFSNPRTGYDLRGASYSRLRETPLQWPVPPDDSEDRHPIRYINDGISQDLFTDADGATPRLAFPTPSRRAVFYPRPHMDPAEMPDDEFPIVLNTGRLQHQWHTLTKTGKVAKLNKLNPGPFVEIHPDDAKSLSIADGDHVEISSRRGRAVLPAIVTDRVLRGGCFTPFHWNDEQGENLAINAVTSDAVDPMSLQPEFKFCAVKLAPVAPAPRTTAAHPLAASLGIETVVAPTLSDLEKIYVGGFLSALTGTVEGVPTLPAAAPLSTGARAWVDGLLAGMYSRGTQSVEAPTPAADVGRRILVLWASQTGNAEEYAVSVASRFADAGLSPTLMNMDECSVDALSGDVVVISSTFGDGGPPDNGADFWSRISADSAPSLSGVRYGVLGMGDSSYDDFCGHARALDARFEKLGAVRLLDLVRCEPGEEEDADRWLSAVTEALGDSAKPVVRSGGGGVAVLERTRTAVFTKANPVLATLVTNTVLSSPASQKEVRQFGFHLGDSGATYEPGDSLGIVPRNSPVMVHDWLSATGLDGTRSVDVDGQDVQLAEALATRYDIAKVSPALLEFVAARNSDTKLAKLLRRDNKTELDNWLYGRQTPDLLRAFPVHADMIEWGSVLKKLVPRQYSISSSPLVSPDEVQLTVSVVRYLGENDAALGGVCSTYMADRVADGTVPVYLQKSPHFRPPTDPATPMIMIGPGTGIAPFRGFLHHRRALGHGGRNWLFFGDQHIADNFYYRTELEDMFRDGFLTRIDLAFSRDQRERIYVQDRMIEHGAEFWKWLQEGANVYVCGDAARMAKDVDDTLVTIASVHGNLSEEEAVAYKKKLVADKRYVRDVY